MPTICYSSQATSKRTVKADAYVAGLWFVLPLCLFIIINLFSSGEYSLSLGMFFWQHVMSLESKDYFQLSGGNWTFSIIFMS